MFVCWFGFVYVKKREFNLHFSFFIFSNINVMKNHRDFKWMAQIYCRHSPIIIMNIFFIFFLILWTLTLVYHPPKDAQWTWNTSSKESYIPEHSAEVEGHKYSLLSLTIYVICFQCFQACDILYCVFYIRWSVTENKVRQLGCFIIT